MGKINSRAKGASYERKLAALITGYGWQARRTGFYQAQPGHDSADVEAKDLPIHWECKASNRAQIRDWLAQAVGDCRSDQFPVVAWRATNNPWVGIMKLEDLLTILQFTDLDALRAHISESLVEEPDRAVSVASEAAE